MTEEKENTEMDPYLGELFFQLQGSAWIHMGKVAHPTSGKVERNLEAAKGAIDMLGMLETKTRGNLTKMEEGVLRELLQQVRLNFVSEQEKGDSPAEPTAAFEAGDADDPGAAGAPNAAGDSRTEGVGDDGSASEAAAPEKGPSEETSEGPETNA
jgi:hypothetical protein